MPKPNKRTTAADANPRKKQRARLPRPEVHPLQQRLADRATDTPGTIIAATRGAGKPRVVGRWLDRIVPEAQKTADDSSDEDEPLSKRKSKAVEEENKPLLAIIVTTDVKHGKEQAPAYGCDFLKPYHDSELAAVLKQLKGEGSVRIWMPK